METRFLCKQCRHVFDLAKPGDSDLDNKIHCPACGSSDVIEAPTWAPLGSGWNIFESTSWEYECQQCKHTFKLPIPKSPEEDKNRRCPICNSGHLHLLIDNVATPLYCG
jgi:DNA-directed RNA polymerase subunit RPC12/RpoP